jgi:hypothetical protein
MPATMPLPCIDACHQPNASPVPQPASSTREPEETESASIASHNSGRANALNNRSFCA